MEAWYSEAHADVDVDAHALAISVAAELAGMHAQTLRTYDRLGLVVPQRTPSGGRRYSLRDVAQLREVQRLSQEEGINLAGIKRIIALSNQVAALQSRVVELLRELDSPTLALASPGPAGPAEHKRPATSTAVVVWTPRGKKSAG